jgi:hypothetical protein
VRRYGLNRLLEAHHVGEEIFCPVGESVCGSGQ